MNKQVAPKYYGYSGGYTKLTQCRSCLRTGLYEDQHKVNPCPECGGVVSNYGAGKWIEPVYDGFLFWRKLIKPGYWKMAKRG